MRVKAGLIFLGATCGIFSAGALVAPPWASSTNAGTAVSSTCGADGRWVVAMSVTSQYDGVIHIRLDDPHGPTPLMELAPFATKTITEHPDTGSTTWTWAWTSTDGHLTGPAVSGTAPRPDGCTPPPTSGTTTTTTCAQAIPPRSDCGGTTSSTPTSSTPSSIPSATSPTSPPTSTAPTIPISATSAPKPSKPSATTYVGVSASLPVTGSGSTIVWVAVALLLGGSVAILVTVRRRRP